MSEKQKIIKRIKKLLAMANDSSSPNEAMIAANRARKLMDKYQISELDFAVETTEFGQEYIVAGKQRIQKWNSIIALNVGKLNSCIVTIKKVGKISLFEFSGLASDSILAMFHYQYVVDTMERLAKEKYSKVVDRNNFRYGFAIGIASKVNELLAEREKENLQTKDKKSLIVVKSNLVEEKFGKQKTSTTSFNSQGSQFARNDGIKSGKQTNFSTPITTDKRSMLK